MTIFIIAVMLSLSFPLIKKNIETAGFRAFVNKVYLFLDYGRTRAVLKDRTVIIKVDQAESVVRLYDKGRSAEEFLQIPPNIEIFSDGENALFFYPDGTSGQFKLTISGTKEQESVFLSRGWDGKIIVTDDNQTTL